MNYQLSGMLRVGALWILMTLAGCGRAAPADTVDSLVAHPDRLTEVMHECRIDHAKLGDAACNAASEAFRRRFVGDGKGQYTPQPSSNK